MKHHCHSNLSLLLCMNIATVFHASSQALPVQSLETVWSDVPSDSKTGPPSDWSSDLQSDTPSIRQSDAPSDTPSMQPSIVPTVSGIECSQVSYNDSDSFEVCYKATAEAISGISAYENGTETGIAAQVYTYNFEIYDAEKMFTGLAIKVQRSGEVEGNDDRTECEYIQVNDETCSTCTYCGNDTYTADCTNIENGRSLVCEEVFPVYFPLTAAAIAWSPVSPDCTTINDGVEDFGICFTATAEASSSISTYENGTETGIASQVYTYNYEIYDEEKMFTGFVIKVQRAGEVEGNDDRTECEFIQVNDESCSTCTYCGNDTYTADCTNIAYGRSLECETIAPVFVPLMAAAITGSPIIPNCTTIDDGFDVFDVCYTAGFAAISSIGAEPNSVASQKYFYDYLIYDEQTETPMFNISMTRSGEVQGTDDRTECDFVNVNGTLCTGCSYCGNETFTADCTNLPNGRYVECEAAFPLFFPFTSDTYVKTPPQTPPPITDCTEIDDGNGPFEVCSISQGMSSISVKEEFTNGTEPIMIQSTSYMYTIYINYDTPAGIVISTGRSGEVQGTEDRTVCDYVDVNGELCNSCKFCGSDLLSADCTNLEFGREVECEPISPLFYPFTVQKLK